MGTNPIGASCKSLEISCVRIETDVLDGKLKKPGAVLSSGQSCMVNGIDSPETGIFAHHAAEKNRNARLKTANFIDNCFTKIDRYSFIIKSQ
jgi:hypothetical protein